MSQTCTPTRTDIMPFRLTWMIKNINFGQVKEDILEKTLPYPNFFPHIDANPPLALVIGKPQESNLFVTCNRPPAHLSTSEAGFVCISKGKTLHAQLDVQFSYGTCIRDILTQIATVLECIIVSVTIEDSQTLSTTYAVRLDTHPCFPFTSQLQEHQSLATLQKWLGADSWYTAWDVPHCSEALRMLLIANQTAESQLLKNAKFGLDGLATAQVLSRLLKIWPKRAKMMTWKPCGKNGQMTWCKTES